MTKRVIRDLSELSVLKEAASEPARENSEGGFIVGRVIGSQDESTNEDSSGRPVLGNDDPIIQVGNLASNETPLPADGHSFYDPELDRFGRLTFEQGAEFFTTRLSPTQYSFDELEYNRELNSWVLKAPDAAMPLVNEYRQKFAEFSDIEKISDRLFYEFLMEAVEEGGEGEQAENWLEELVADYLAMRTYHDRDNETNTDIIIEDETDEIEKIVEETIDEIFPEEVETEEVPNVDLGAVEIIEDVPSDVPVQASLTEFLQQRAESMNVPVEPQQVDNYDPHSPSLTILVGDTVATVDEGEATIVAADGETVIQEVTIETRETLIAEIERFMVPGTLAAKTPLNQMNIRELRQHLQFLKNHTGGSPEMSILFADVERDYEALVNAPETKRRLTLLAQKGADFYKLAQKISQVMGNDITLRGLRYQEYHQLLEYMTRSTSIIFSEITKAADYMGILLPIEEMIPSMGAVPIIEGMPIDEKTAMYVLRCLVRSLENWHHTVLTLNEKLDAQKVNFANLTSEYERVKTRLEEELTQREALIDNVKSRFIEHPEFFIYVPSGNAYIGLKDEDEKLSVANLKLVTDIRDALFLSHRSAAERIIEALDNHTKFSTYSYSIRRIASVEV